MLDLGEYETGEAIGALTIEGGLLAIDEVAALLARCKPEVAVGDAALVDDLGEAGAEVGQGAVRRYHVMESPFYCWYLPVYLRGARYGPQTPSLHAREGLQHSVAVGIAELIQPQYVTGTEGRSAAKRQVAPALALTTSGHDHALEHVGGLRGK